MAVMVHPGLFVGTGADTYKFAGSILHCAKEPWFEGAVSKATCSPGSIMEVPMLRMLGSQGVNKSNTVARPAYNEMALNMVDAESPKYFSNEMVNAGLDFISERFAEGDAVLAHCNMGLSRSPSICFLWMYERGFLDDEFRYAVPQFKEIYKDWMPGSGIWQYLKQRCEKQNAAARVR